MKNKKGVELTLSTVIVTIIILIVLAIAIIFIIKYGGSLSAAYNDLINNTITATPKEIKIG
ncbi:MAG TPA: hypothetical protein VJB89_02915 [Candidatus Nanoarchaeia archaeon]|nr:hypothetical protein [Candidatus Nanoarchaeia archaeon]